MKTCWFVAGPNGAGKSTLAKQYLPPARVVLEELRQEEEGK